MNVKPKKCRHCKLLFTPVYRLAVVCSFECALHINEKKKEAEARKRKAAKKIDLMTKSDWVKALQQVFNTYVRLRDKNKPCVSCDTPLTGKYDAGHYFSCGAYPALRFDEDNTHGQCVRCNQHLHGNISEYSIRLPERIGAEAYEALKSRRGNVCQYSIPELKELISDYKLKLKLLTP